MGYLGLSDSDPLEKEDNLFRRLFWPSDHAGEADTLGQQGFWICCFVAITSFVALSFQGYVLIGLLALVFFGLGGIGVREHSTAAAVLLAVAYITMAITGILLGRPPGFIDIAVTILLIANIRGTWIAKRWAKRGDPDVFSERMRETWRDRLADQMPAYLWPKSRIIFFGVAGVYMALLILGIVFVVQHPRYPVTVERERQTLEVKPPQ